MTEFWYDTQAGKMIAGEAAYEEAVTQSFPGDIVPLPELLITPDFPYQPGDFVEKGKKLLWSTEEKLQLGVWALQLLEQAAGEPTMLKTQPHIKRLRILGLSPDPEAFKEFGSFMSFRELIGSPIAERGRNGVYANWSLQEYVEYARSLERELGRKPIGKDFNAAGGPTEDIILRRVGGLRLLNEYLGYPDVRAWDESDYLSWAGSVIAANGIEEFSSWHVLALMYRRRGPGLRAIESRFSTWTNFKDQAIAAYKYERDDAAAMHRHKINSYKTMLETGDLPVEYGELDEAMLLQRAGRYLVIQGSAPTISEYYKKNLATKSIPIIPALREIIPELTAEHIELVAVTKGVFDDVWPIDAGLENLKVSEDELAVVRARRAAIKRRSDAKKRNRLKSAA